MQAVECPTVELPAINTTQTYCEGRLHSKVFCRADESPWTYSNGNCVCKRVKI